MSLGGILNQQPMTTMGGGLGAFVETYPVGGDLPLYQGNIVDIVNGEAVRKDFYNKQLKKETIVDLINESSGAFKTKFFIYDNNPYLIIAYVTRDRNGVLVLYDFLLNKIIARQEISFASYGSLFLSLLQLDYNVIENIGIITYPRSGNTGNYFLFTINNLGAESPNFTLGDDYFLISSDNRTSSYNTHITNSSSPNVVTYQQTSDTTPASRVLYSIDKESLKLTEVSSTPLKDTLKFYNQGAPVYISKGDIVAVAQLEDGNVYVIYNGQSYNTNNTELNSAVFTSLEDDSDTIFGLLFVDDNLVRSVKIDVQQSTLTIGEAITFNSSVPQYGVYITNIFRDEASSSEGLLNGFYFICFNDKSPYSVQYYKFDAEENTCTLLDSISYPSNCSTAQFLEIEYLRMVPYYALFCTTDTFYKFNAYSDPPGIGSSFDNNASTAIVISKGGTYSPGAMVSVCYSGIVKTDWNYEGQILTSAGDGVYGVGVTDGVLQVFPKYRPDRIKTGSYVGDGSYGVGNPNSLTFSFKPKAFFIYGDHEEKNPNPLSVWIDPSIYLEEINIGSTEFYGNIMNVSGNTLYWYSKKSATNQYNVENYTYYYMAIG